MVEEKLDEPIDTSKFNAAQLKMLRLHKLLDEINAVRLQPLAFNPMYLCYNYEVWLRNLGSLLEEACGKMSAAELKTADELHKKVRVSLRQKPIHEQVYSPVRRNSEMVVSHQNWLQLEPKLEEFERLIRLSLNKHDFDAPSKKTGGVF